MDVKAQITALQAKLQPQFGGIHFHVTSTPDSRLHVSVEADVSVDLPGDLDMLLAAAANAFGLGNSPSPSPSSGG